MLFEQRSANLTLLLDLYPLIPESLIDRALWLCDRARDEKHRELLLKLLRARRKGIKLTGDSPLTRSLRRQIARPASKRARLIIEPLASHERVELFEKIFFEIEREKGLIGETAIERTVHRRTARAKPPDKIALTFGAPPEETGGGGIEEIAKGVPADLLEPSAAAPPPQAPAPAKAEVPPDIVNLGFAHTDAVDKTFGPAEPLSPGESYYFWFNIGGVRGDAIDPTTSMRLGARHCSAMPH